MQLISQSSIGLILLIVALSCTEAGQLQESGSGCMRSGYSTSLIGLFVDRSYGSSVFRLQSPAVQVLVSFFLPTVLAAILPS